MTKYRSKLEKRVHEANPHLLYEPKEYILEYSISHKYQVDFVDPDEPNIYYEVKGYFRPGTARKYVALKEQHPDIEIIFIFPQPYNKMTGARPRKDGTTMTMAEWAEKGGFRWEKA
jgi:hypothetical protein